MWANHHFELGTPDDKGVTEKEHLEQVERQLGHKPERLKEPVKFPSLLGHVWAAFCRLSNSRSHGYSGPNALSPSVIKDWMEISGCRLSPRDVETLEKIDQTYLRKAHG